MKKNTAVNDDAENLVAVSEAPEPDEATDAATTPEADDTVTAPEPQPATSAVPTPAVDDAEESLPEKDPGKVLGIVGIVIALGVGIVGIVLGLLSYRKSRAVGYGGGFGMTAMIVGAVTTVLLGTQLFLMASGMGIGGACDGRKAGVYELDNGTTISCT
ncbi:DUF4190 domain-containing protein [Salinibacterium sp. dk5596]|uniref:DUF4190 domain-containing protein n=1 Tax=Salinibacterium sp. dk5596 TaxID=2603291 RepID=UPI0011C90E1D|nr:DUF4190 domain-containing protein [Salinibacterium sp. dk5596]TXK52689.1 hypothetical protein FVP63_12155 [Salinibacterium sp. dk5596]